MTEKESSPTIGGILKSLWTLEGSEAGCLLDRILGKRMQEGCVEALKTWNHSPGRLGDGNLCGLSREGVQGAAEHFPCRTYGLKQGSAVLTSVEPAPRLHRRAVRTRLEVEVAGWVMGLSLTWKKTVVEPSGMPR